MTETTNYMHLHVDLSGSSCYIQFRVQSALIFVYSCTLIYRELYRLIYKNTLIGDHPCIQVARLDVIVGEM